MRWYIFATIATIIIKVRIKHLFLMILHSFTCIQFKDCYVGDRERLYLQKKLWSHPSYAAFWKLVNQMTVQDVVIMHISEEQIAIFPIWILEFWKY